MEKIQLVHIGKVLRPHGLKGELCIDIYADSPFLLDRVSRIYFQRPGHRPKPVVLSRWQPHGQRIIVALEATGGRRDEAAFWTGADILMRARDLPELDEGEYFCRQLEGMDVFLRGGEFLGHLENVLSLSGREVWKIITEDGKEILFPAVQEFVDSVDMEQKKIVITPPDGLLDVYL
ncbi:MAG: ribosome maturation factor RimM [Desulfoplanes sp.]|nr:ribosome maturation factor RimM [Desulfoplanes sp.]MDD4648724.1 ribosome maturation factor RimM [Desulfoplanes sp.]